MSVIDSHTRSIMSSDEDEVLVNVDSLEPGLYGTVSVKNGKILVTIPEGADKPTVKPGEGVELYLNGVLQNNAVQVSPQDKVEIKTKTIFTKGTYKVDIADNKMEAFIVIEPSRVVKYKISDQPPQRELTILASPTEKTESPLSLPQLETLLTKNNLNMTRVDLTEAIFLIQNPEAGRAKVAGGIPPKPAVEARVEILFPQNDDNYLTESDNGLVDYRSTKIFRVEEGTLLARKIPAVPGKPGMNIFGKVIEPPAVNEAIFLADKGTVTSQDGNEVYAAANGQPVLKKAGRKLIFSVEEVLLKKEDIDIKTGNIFFNGRQVVLHGNVQESMTVQTSGKLFVGGYATGAKLVSYDNMKLQGNLFRCSINVGVDEKGIHVMQSTADSINQDLIRIVEIIRSLSKQKQVQYSNASYGYMLKLVLEQMYRDLPLKVKSLEKLTQATLPDLPQSISKIFNLANKIILSPHLVANEDALTNLLQGFILTRDYFQGIIMRKAKLELNESTNCQIAVTGDILVIGKGCFNTTLKAGGNVKIMNLFRGGELLAGGSVIIGEAGTKIGTKTLVATASKQIKIQTCNEGVVIRIGKQARVVREKTDNLTAYIDEDGKLHSNSDKLNII